MEEKYLYPETAVEVITVPSLPIAETDKTLYEYIIE